MKRALNTLGLALLFMTGTVGAAPVDGGPRLLRGTTREAGGYQGERQRASIAAPKRLHGQRLFMAGSEGATVRALSWDATPGAAGYKFELFREGEQKPLHRLETVKPSLPAPLVGLEPGLYRIVITARDGLGFASEQKLESSLHVLTASLPKGSYVDAAGALRVAPDAEVYLAPIEGLEMALRRKKYVPASSTISLPNDQPTTMFLRQAGADYELPIRIVPRSVRARIAITPEHARWPDDPLTIGVALEDPSGQPIPEWLEMMPRVKIGLVDVDVDFHAVGSHLEATLPPRQGDGPWVVLVEVEDQYGYALGCDSLEVERGR